MVSHDHHVPETACPTCGKLQDGAMEAIGKGGPPEERDISICIDCGAVSVFAADLKLRKPTTAEWRAMVDDKEFWDGILKMRSAINDVKRKFN